MRQTIWLRNGLLMLVGASISTACAVSVPSRAPVKMKTYTYKKVDDLEIRADVHRPDDEVKRPVVVWIHGGALIMGGRQGVPERVKSEMLDAGYVIVSIDYRLAPETLLPGIIEDLEDAFRWIRDEGPALFNADADRIAVMGSSAGGYLTLTSGIRVEPRPTVLLSFYGYGDLVGSWYSSPSKHARHQGKSMSPEEAERLTRGPPVANSGDREGDGGAFYRYCRQRGLWPRMIAGFDPHSETEKFVPYMAVRNVTSDYPPTVLIHGTEDTDVPYELSDMMAAEFRKHRVPHLFITIENGEHGLGGGDPQKIDAAYRDAFEFVKERMTN